MRSLYWLSVSVLLGTGGCGWHPIYAPSSGRSAASGALDRVEVSIIPERSGQLLRQALQDHLRQTGSESPPAFVLDARYSVTQEGIGITENNSVTRMRMIATSSFVLRALRPGTPTCLSGSVRQVDGFDEENQQFFTADLEAETVQRRLADAVANEIVTKLALALNTQRAGCEI